LAKIRESKTEDTTRIITSFWGKRLILKVNVEKLSIYSREKEERPPHSLKTI